MNKLNPLDLDFHAQLFFTVLFILQIKEHSELAVSNILQKNMYNDVKANNNVILFLLSTLIFIVQFSAW